MTWLNADGEQYETRCAVICRDHGRVGIPDAEELAQLENPDTPWRCPKCGEAAEWDDNCPATNPHDVIGEIGAERERQIENEGWDAAHDDQHSSGELTSAALAYLSATITQMGFRVRSVSEGVPTGWPWDVGYWKPKDPRRNLIRAAALIVAEIEKMDRAA